MMSYGGIGVIMPFVGSQNLILLHLDLAII